MHQPLAATANSDFVTSEPSALRAHWRILTLCALSALLTVIFVYGRPFILYNDGDPLTYFRKAWWYIGHVGGMEVPSRGPGYSIWLILTGAASLDTWWGLVASHVAMAFAAPLLVYGILSPISRNAGFVAGLLFILFAISYQHMSWVMTEELFLFMELVSLLLISRHLCRGWEPVPEAGSSPRERILRSGRLFLRTPYAIALALAYTTMVKPAAGPFFWIFIVVCLLFRVQPWKRYVGPVVLYAAIMTAWGTFDYRNSPVRFSPLGMPTTPTQRNFADVYYGQGSLAVRGWTPAAADRQQSTDPAPSEGHSRGTTGQQPVFEVATIRADKGPATQKLYQAVTDLIEKQRRTGQWNTTDAESIYQLYGRYTRDQLLEAIFVRPNPLYYQTIIAAAASAGGDQLLHDVAREHGNAGAMAYVNYLLRHPTVPILGPPNPYVGFMFFMKFYRYQNFKAAGHRGPRDLLGPTVQTNLYAEQHGPASKEFAQSIRFFLAAFPQFVGLPPEVIQEFGSKEAFVKYVIDNPFSPKHSGAVMGWVYQWFSLLIGEEQTGSVMGAAARESISATTGSLGLLVGDYLSAIAFAGDGSYGPIEGYFSATDLISRFSTTFERVRDVNDDLLRRTIASGKVNNLPESMKPWVGEVGSRSQLQASVNAAQSILYGLFKWLKPVFFLLTMLFVVPLLMTSPGRGLVLFLTVAFFASAAAWLVVMIMPGSDPRHEEVFAFFPMLISILGLAHLPHILSHMLRSRNSSLYDGGARMREPVSAPAAL